MCFSYSVDIQGPSQLLIESEPVQGGTSFTRSCAATQSRRDNHEICSVLSCRRVTSECVPNSSMLLDLWNLLFMEEEAIDAEHASSLPATQ